MKLFKDELFSLQIDPTSKNDPALLLSMYSNGDFLVETASPFSMNDKRTLLKCFTILDKTLLASISSLVTKLGEDLKDAPSNLLIEGYTGSQYTLSILGHLYNGDYAYTHVPSFARHNAPCPTEVVNRVKYSNFVLKFGNEFSSLVVGKSIKGKPLENPVEEDYLKPVSRFLLFLIKEESNGIYKIVTSKEEALKEAAKKALLPQEFVGANFNKGFSLLAQSLLPLLHSSKDQASFDTSHSSLCHELMTYSLSYVEAASWIDFSYLYLLLLEEDIVNEKEVNFLHSPASSSLLTDLYKGGNEDSYLTYQKEGREEWSKMDISPIYFYLESIYNASHPKEGTGVGVA